MSLIVSVRNLPPAFGLAFFVKPTFDLIVALLPGVVRKSER